jgi:hypothetical protein
MTLIARLRRSLDIIRAQQALIDAQREMINNQRIENARIRLDHCRQLLGLASAWRIHMETPELDLRDDLTVMCNDWADMVATLEEHVV